MKTKMLLMICFVIFGIVLSGCSYNNLTNSDKSSNMQECEAYGYFSNLDDFYTFATTGSRDASQYTDPHTAREVHRYNSIDVSALLKVEEIFNDRSSIEELAEVHVYEKTNTHMYLRAEWL